ncbi:uncharacterized protein FOBCDRAFT_244765 [Fusarium oxysporum Fo47]|uniref:uncharacterized protein n=1 Tax=Fusarium oxysporum Fo47 TaxID=660027 RepID=UPI002869CBBB|nr:uncharacterized protein FOBCDRAFT_244765 [Fusarium oxysporum Fo47]WJG37062.1 hypothetical protein FOBCDRAFT_244765 [Fusarium oxysporum Fo47]
MVESWNSLITSTMPDAEIKLFYAIIDDILLGASEFDLIDFTGGVEKTLAFIRETAKTHQAVARAMGGEIKFNPYYDRALPEFHKRRVARPALRFVPLAEDNDTMLHKEYKIMIFQGHPEMAENFGMAILHADYGAYTGNVSEKQAEELDVRFSLPHDGQRSSRFLVIFIPKKNRKL